MNFFKIPKNIFSRDFYEMITVGLFGSFYIIFLIAIYSGVISITQDPFPKYILLFSFPLFLIFLYLSKIFPQERIGNCLHIIIFGLIIAAANTYWGGNIRINGPLLSAYILLMPIYALLLDPFLPWFIASIVSIGLILEFILAGSISFLSGIEFFCKILVFFVIAFSSSTLIKKILLEQKNERRIKKAYQIEKKNREQAEKLASQEKILREQAEDLAEGLKQLDEAIY
ncbi:MAG: hypothetical protein PHO28_04030 [Candidatus Pacebacteria bacterium]|nr:hypothetical protein [Candidatus Paceibacterota bacterium]